MSEQIREQVSAFLDGELPSSPVSPAKVGDRLRAKLLWLVREPLTLDKSYLLKIGAKTTPAIVRAVTARIEIETGLAAPLLAADETLAFNAIGEAELTLELGRRLRSVQ